MRTKVLKHPNVGGFHSYQNHHWRLWGYVPPQVEEIRQRVVRAYSVCCWPTGSGDQRCGKIAFYRVKFSGFCEGHKAEAYKTQRAYWTEKYNELLPQYEKISRRDHV